MAKCFGKDKMRILITGHCGFIGKFAWEYFKGQGHDVFGIDDLSRKTSRRIEDKNSVIADIADIASIPSLDIHFDWVIHLAAQVSVVESIQDPVRDFKTNAEGTFRVLQWAKKRNAGLIYASTNKVFGELLSLSSPVLDSQPIIPSTNYGVSKCVGAQYVADYNRGWVLHQSCIYGEAQVGDINQGWIGWLRQQVRNNDPITCFGDGTQVRDLLHVSDLVRLYDMVVNGEISKGSYVTGGGSANAYSFSQVVSLLGGEIATYEDWRPNDQKYFVSANAGLQEQNWFPAVSFLESLDTL